MRNGEWGMGNGESGSNYNSASGIYPNTPNRSHYSLLPTPYSLIILVFLLVSCTSLIQKGGEVLEGSAFEEKTIALYRSATASSGIRVNEVIFELRKLRLKDGGEAVEITSNAWPGFALRGTRPDDNGNFHLTQARIFSSHIHGWNEFTLDLLGDASFPLEGEMAGLLLMDEEVERVQISSGMIRLKSNYITGNAALAPLRNRRERILALTEWMKEWRHNNSADVYFASEIEFANYWKPRLFPELASKKNRPPEYSTENAEWNRADSVNWNCSYTKRIFPEELYLLRNSGALLRDWEEAQAWIYLEYSWNNIIGLLHNNNLYRADKSRKVQR